MVTTINKNFKLIAPIQKDYSDDDFLFIEGIANSGEEDLVGDIVTTEALKQIVSQAPTRNLHLDHNDGKENIVGTIVESELREEGAWIKALILQEHREWLKSYLEQGVKYGLSISGTCDYEDGSMSNIVDWQLTEISLTDTPCDPATMGTVSITKSFDDIIKKIKYEKKEETNMADEQDTFTLEDVTKLINDAFNERKEEFLETIRDEIKGEYETNLNELKERIETLESKIEQANEDNGNGGDNTGADNTGADKDGDSNTDEDEEKSIDELVDAKVKQIIGGISKDLNFKYDEHKKVDDVETDKKTFDPHEIATMI